MDALRRRNMPNDGPLPDQLATWAPGEELRRKILLENTAPLYGFDKR